MILLMGNTETDAYEDEALAREVVEASRALGEAIEVLGGSFGSDYDESEGVNQLLAGKHMMSDLFKQLIILRDYAIYGRLSGPLEDPQDLYSLVLMSMPAIELYGGNLALGCAEVLQGVVARKKIDDHLGRFPEELEALNYCEGFCSGSQYQGLTFYELSVLAQMTQQAVKNDITKNQWPTTYREASESEEGGTLISGGRSQLVTVLLDDAYAWLKKRRSFTDTHQISDENSGSYSVPEARDGSIFDACCRTSRGYRVGKKGQEKEYEKYEDALNALREMPKPYWPRPSPTSGIFGIVTGTAWVDKTKDELGLWEERA